MVNDDKEAMLAGFASVALDYDWTRSEKDPQSVLRGSDAAGPRGAYTTASDVDDFAETCLEVSSPLSLDGDAPDSRLDHGRRHFVQP